MLILGAQPVPADAHHASCEVDMFPLEPERFALPQSERQGNHPLGAVAPFAGDREESPDFLDRVRFGFLLSEPWRLCQQHRVLQDVSAAHCLIERVPDRPVDVVRGSGGQPFAHHLGVELFDVLRG